MDRRSPSKFQSGMSRRVPERHRPQIDGEPGRERRGRQGGDLQGDHSDGQVKDSQVQDGQDVEQVPGRHEPQGGHKVEFPSEFPSGMDRRSPEDDFPRTIPEAEFPSKFPSGVDRETENPAASTADDKAASYATLFTSQMSYRRAEFPSGETAMYKVTIQFSTPDQASKLSSTGVRVPRRSLRRRSRRQVYSSRWLSSKDPSRTSRRSRKRRSATCQAKIRTERDGVRDREGGRPLPRVRAEDVLAQGREEDQEDQD